MLKKLDDAHLGAKARVEELQEEIARIYKDFPGLKRTTPLTKTLSPRKARTKAVSRRTKAAGKSRKAKK